MKRLALIGILILVFAFATKTLYSVGTLKPQEENLIEIAHQEIFGKLEYGKVIFKHQIHVEAMAKILGKTQETVCTECHKEKEGTLSFDFVTGKTSDEIKNSYHSKCLSCHQKLSAKNIKTEPEILSCRDCHKKEYERTTVKYPPFDFDFVLHEKHVKKHQNDCSLCHHTYDIEEENKELALVYEKGTEQSCYYCHDLSRKRGPELSKIVKVAKEKNLNLKNSFHLLCVDCHVSNKIQGNEAGPIVCSKCHTGKYKTLDELKDAQRPEMDQPKIAFINIENAKMKGVPFNHEFHEKNNKHCRDCHHETLKSCKECHDLKGKEEGGFVNITTAYHSLNSQVSCQGCHRKNIISNNDCTGCHYFISPVKTELANREVCQRCHTGKKETEKTSEIVLPKEKVKEEVAIKHIEKEFEPVKMPHYKIAKKLTDISNTSRLATYFHANSDTICRGCHHKSKETAEAKKSEPPLCVNCHSLNFEPMHTKKLRLQSAYHGMCIKCHESMKIEKPKKCTDCHERKVVKNAIN